MNKTVFIFFIAGVLLAGSVEAAKPLPAELIMPGGRFWKGQVVGRDGDWLEFATEASAQPIRVGVNTIQELAFQLDLDTDRLDELNQTLQYPQAIGLLESALRPYEPFQDLPSNLAPFYSMLMELYYKTENYAASLEYASRISDYARDEELKRKSVVFRGMCLIAAGRLSEADALFASHGWTRDLTDDAPPEDLYITARFLFAKKDYAAAMETVAKVVAFHSDDREWVRPAELLCAEIYLEMGMLDSASEVVREMALIYKDSFEAEQAQKLKLKIDAARDRQNRQEL